MESSGARPLLPPVPTSREWAVSSKCKQNWAAIKIHAAACQLEFTVFYIAILNQKNARNETNDNTNFALDKKKLLFVTGF